MKYKYIKILKKFVNVGKANKLNDAELLRAELILKQEKYKNKYDGFEAISDYLTVACLNEKRKWSIITTIIDYLMQLYEWIIFTGSGYHRKNPENIDAVYIWTHDRKDQLDRLIEIARYHKMENILFIVLNDQMKNRLRVELNVACMTISELPRINMCLWKKSFQSYWNRIEKLGLRSQLKVFANKEISRYIKSKVMLATKLMETFEIFTEQNNIKIVISGYDRSLVSAAIIQVANQKGIPSVALVHGPGVKPYPSYGLRPIATKICCWGGVHEAYILQNGAREDQVVVTGNHISLYNSMPRENIRSSRGISSCDYVILYATSPVNASVKIKLVQLFCEYTDEFREIKRIIKLHPAEEKSEYLKIDYVRNNVFLYDSNDLSTNDSFAIADLVVVAESAYGGDALLRGVPVIVLDSPLIKLRFGRDLIDRYGCISVQNASQMIAAIEYFRAKKNKGNLGNSCLQLSNYPSEEARQNIINLINEVRNVNGN